MKFLRFHLQYEKKKKKMCAGYSFILGGSFIHYIKETQIGFIIFVTNTKI